MPSVHNVGSGCEDDVSDITRHSRRDILSLGVIADTQDRSRNENVPSRGFGNECQGDTTGESCPRDNVFTLTMVFTESKKLLVMGNRSP